jgi:hypothetical protein
MIFNNFNIFIKLISKFLFKMEPSNNSHQEEESEAEIIGNVRKKYNFKSRKIKDMKI